jgi:predicted deacylase
MITESILVGHAGAVEINLPLLKLGSGDPQVLILIGLHGDETTGYFVIDKLLDQLTLQKGTLRIIMSANPLGQALHQRWDPINNRDVNRAFPGSSDREFTDRLADKLLKLAKGCDCENGAECHCVEDGKAHDCVIDLHTFGLSRMRTTAIFMNHGKHKVRETSLELIRAFAPECIWQLDTRTEEQQQWAGSMGPEMAGQDIVNFAIEFPASFWAEDVIVNHAVGGFLRVLHHLGMIDAAPPAPAKPPIHYSRDEIAADYAGIWLPRQDLLNAVTKGEFPHLEKGECIGQIVDISSRERHNVTSEQEGLLPVLLSQTIVRVGDTLYVVGQDKPWGMLAEGTIEKIARFAQGMDWNVAFDGKSKGNRHLDRVAKISAYLADEEAERTSDIDRSICRAGAWLHDIGLTINVPGPASIGCPIAESFLRALGEKDVDEETRDRVLHCIAAHDYAPGREGSVKPETLEAEIVHDADTLDKTGPLAVIRHTWKLANSGEPYTPEDVLGLLQDHFEQRKSSLTTPSGQHLLDKLERLYGSILCRFFDNKEIAVSVITQVMEQARKNVITEDIAVSLSDQRDDEFTQALSQQLEQLYLQD